MGLDLDLGRRFLEAHPPVGRALSCAVIGSHLCGYPAPDSDLDLKGIYLAPTAAILGLSQPPETHDRLLDFEGTECDLTLHEAGRALSLLLKGNGNLLEQIASDLQLLDTPALQALQALIPAALSRACYGHYRGYFRGRIRDHRRDGRLKSLLGAFRVGLTGVHVLRTGQVVCHLPTLAETYAFPRLGPLIARRTSEPGKIVLSGDETAAFGSRLDDLGALIDDARDTSPLPDAPPDPDRCEDWLIQIRRSSLQEASP